MEIKGEFNDAGVYEIQAKFCHFEKETVIKVINDILWMVNPANEPRPIEEDKPTELFNTIKKDWDKLAEDLMNGDPTNITSE